MEFLILFGAVLVGLFVGWQARESYAIHQVRRLLENGDIKLNTDDGDEPEEDRMKLRLEKHSGLIYAFADEDDSFIAQGVDLSELDLAIQARFPGKKFSVREDNLKDIGLE